VNLKNFAAEVSGGNVYKGAVAYAGTSWLSYHSFSVFLVKIVKAKRSTAWRFTLRKNCRVNRAERWKF
jgi:hypothetical protein